MNQTRKKEFLRFLGIIVFVFFSGVLIMIFHSLSNRVFSGEINDLITESSLNVERIKREMESMSQEEIEKTIKEIEKKIERLNSEI